MDYISIIESIKTKTDFALFLQKMNEDLITNGEAWENRKLEDYLEAMSGFVTDINENSLIQIDQNPSWKTFAQIMAAAVYYE